jgi:uncharacterized protein YbcC (UPF0753/DUF2309 family)
MLEQLISNIRKKLPIQNPLHSFVHNNILLMFEHLDFHEAVSEAGKLYKARPFWEIYKYLEKFDIKKITQTDIRKSIDKYLCQYKAINSLSLLGLTSEDYFYRLMFSNLSFNDDETQPVLSNTTLWENCLKKMENQSLTLGRSVRYWRGKEYWEKYHNESYALSFHPFMIRLISSYLDQGQSYWPNPFVDKSFWDFFVFDVLSLKGFSEGWIKKLVEKMEASKNLGPSEVIIKELNLKQIPEDVWESYLLEILFDLKGWAGMVNKLETEPDQATVKAPNIKLLDFMAAFLLMESSIDTYHSESASIDLNMIHGRIEKIELRSFQLALAIYQITESFGLDENWMINVETQKLLVMIEEIDQSELRDRVRLWHESFEHHYHREALEAISGHVLKIKNDDIKPHAQILFCIDDREESIRRYVEETDPGIETFGVVGFFGIDMKFSGLGQSRSISQCPPVVVPSRSIREVPLSDSTSFKKWNTYQGLLDLFLYYQSRTLVRGFLSTLILGLLSLIPMSIQVFFPKRSRLIGKKILHLLSQGPKTDIHLERGTGDYGYTKKEMASMVETILRMIGISKFTSMVLVMGHGSSSNNNPFKQAYGCGACGGNAGMPNTRAFVKMANDKLVRSELKKNGIEIPHETLFVGALHDTCTDEVHFLDESLIPDSYYSALDKLKQSLTTACKLNALERCKRFANFTQQSPDEAIGHVKERANDLAQPRPEYGHSSNALAVVGNREITKGLFMNRRSFLLSYDWKSDPDGTILKNVVLGGIPVAVNINMDYYFSSVDNDHFGCGSKLPLNMTALLGVMTGSISDLRIGLARQMVEIHEPIRNLTIIEAPLPRVRGLFDGHPRLKNILYNHWMRLAVFDPIDGKWWVFGHDEYEELHMEHRPLSIFKSSDSFVSCQRDDNFVEIRK